MQPDKILPVQRIRWTANTEGKEAEGKKSCFFLVLIWMTWQQSRPNRHWEKTAVVLGECTDWCCSFQRRHLQPTACHFHVAEAEVCVNVLPWIKSRYVFMWLRITCTQCSHSLAIDLALSSPTVVVYWPFLLGDTCRVLTASWQTRFLNSWLDGGPPIRAHSCTHALERCESCVCMWLCMYQLSACVTGHISDASMQICVCLCALRSYWLIAVWWELKLNDPG